MNSALDSVDSRRQGFWQSGSRILESLLGLVQNRVELFGVELSEERQRSVEALILGAAIAAFAIMGLLLFTFGLVLVFWERGRVAVSFVLGMGYLISAALVWRRLQHRLREARPFSATVGEIRKDREWLSMNQ
jgi:uncharacterized membrane protein YqjE